MISLAPPEDPTFDRGADADHAPFAGSAALRALVAQGLAELAPDA